MPEFKTLDTMYKLCRCAQPTSSSSEFNLYSETEHFFIWLRLITRFRDYNLYVHYYANPIKETVAPVHPSKLHQFHNCCRLIHQYIDCGRWKPVRCIKVGHIVNIKGAAPHHKCNLLWFYSRDFQAALWEKFDIHEYPPIKFRAAQN